MLLVHEDDTSLTRYQFITHFCMAVAAIGAPVKNYAVHSFCIGAASAAAASGFPIRDICTIGRWLSSAFKDYIRPFAESQYGLQAVSQDHLGGLLTISMDNVFSFLCMKVRGL